MGQGRVLLQEMALVKAPKISGEKPWHQDAAYFRGSDPNLMFGVWIALDPATHENGCMMASAKCAQLSARSRSRPRLWFSRSVICSGDWVR